MATVTRTLTNFLTEGCEKALSFEGESIMENVASGSRSDGKSLEEKYLNANGYFLSYIKAKYPKVERYIHLRNGVAYSVLKFNGKILVMEGVLNEKNFYQGSIKSLPYDLKKAIRIADYDPYFSTKGNGKNKIIFDSMYALIEDRKLHKILVEVKHGKSSNGESIDGQAHIERASHQLNCVEDMMDAIDEGNKLVADKLSSLMVTNDVFDRCFMKQYLQQRRRFEKRKEKYGYDFHFASNANQLVTFFKHLEEIFIKR